MSMDPPDEQSLVKRYGPVVIVAIIVGAAVAPVAWSQGTDRSDGTVAVISIDETITASTSQEIAAELQRVRQNSSIKAVVLNIDSPGGSAAASEGLYLAVRETAEEMPVVAAVDGIGASGAYYAMMPASTIYVKPASLIGSVGVRGSEPFSGDVPGQITTGPDKNGGFTADEARAQIETLRKAFVGTVFKHRSDRLSLSRAEVSNAKVYTGASATENGIADEIGTTGSAIEEAANLAGLENYDVVRKNPAQFGFFILVSSDSSGKEVVVQQNPFEYAGVEAPRYLMLYGELEENREVIANETG